MIDHDTTMPIQDIMGPSLQREEVVFLNNSSTENAPKDATSESDSESSSELIIQIHRALDVERAKLKVISKGKKGRKSNLPNT